MNVGFPVLALHTSAAGFNNSNDADSIIAINLTVGVGVAYKDGHYGHPALL